MSITLDATIGGANSNSLLSIERAGAILEKNMGSRSDWANADGETKKSALITATERIELDRWKGRRATETQALSFPRLDLIDQNGEEYADNIIIPDIEYGVALLAAALIRNPRLLEDTGLENLSSVSTAEKSITQRGLRPGRLPGQVERYLSRWRVEGDGYAQAIRN